jgi:hypothetical protein
MNRNIFVFSCLFCSFFVVFLSSCVSGPRPFPDYPNIYEDDQGPDGILYRVDGVTGARGKNLMTDMGLDPRVRIRDGVPIFILLVSWHQHDWIFMEKLHLWNDDGNELDIALTNVNRTVSRGTEVMVNERCAVIMSQRIDQYEQWIKGTNPQLRLYGRYRHDLFMQPAVIKRHLDLISFYRFLSNRDQIDM